MPTIDGRVGRFDLVGTSGTTVQLTLTWLSGGTPADISAGVSVYVGGTLGNISDLTGATQYAATIASNVATVNVVVPTTASSLVRLTLGGVVVASGTFTAISGGVDVSNQALTVQLQSNTSVTVAAPSITVTGGGGGGGAVNSVTGTAGVVATPTTGSVVVSPTYGTSAGTVAQGNDSRITGAAQKSANLSDLANATTARTNLGLGTAATLASTAVAQTANNLSDLASVTTARTNLGLGSLATLSTVTSAQITDATIAIADLSATGTPSGTTFLRGDNTWAVPAGGGGSQQVGLLKTGATLYHLNGTGSVSGAAIGRGLNSLVAVPFIVGTTGTIDRIGVRATAATASAVVRLGIYSTTNAEPTTLLLDAGTVDFSTTGGFKEIVISQAVTAGQVLWLAAVNQGALASNINTNGQPVTPIQLHALFSGALDNLIGFPYSGYIHTAAISGALPSTFTPKTDDLCPGGNTPHFLVRIT